MLCHYNEWWKKNTLGLPRMAQLLRPAWCAKVALQCISCRWPHAGGGKKTVKPVAAHWGAQYSSSPEYADEGQQDAKGHTVTHQRKENWRQQMGSKISDKIDCMSIHCNLSSLLSLSTSSASRGDVSISSWLFWVWFCTHMGEWAIISGTTFILTWKQISLDVTFSAFVF